MDKRGPEEGNTKRPQKPNDGDLMTIPVQVGYSTPQSSGLSEGRTLRSSSTGKNSTPGITTRSMNSHQYATSKSRGRIPRPRTNGKDSTPRLPDRGKRVPIEVTAQSMVSPRKPISGNEDNNQRPSPQGKNDTEMSSAPALSSSPRRTTRSTSSTLRPTDTNITPRPSPQHKGGMQGSSTLGGSRSPRVTTRSMQSAPMPTTTGDIDIPIPSPQSKGVTKSPVTQDKNSTQKVATQNVENPTRPDRQGDSNSESNALNGNSTPRFCTHDEIGILASPTRGRRGSPKPSALPEISIISSPARVVGDTAASSIKDEYSIPRHTTRGKGGAVTTANQTEDRAQQKHSLDAPRFDKKGGSVAKPSREDPGLAEKCVSGIPSSSELVTPIASLPGEVGDTGASFSNVVLPSLSAFPSGFGASLTQCPADVSVSVASCPVEAGASVPPCASEVCPGDIGVPRASCSREVNGSITMHEKDSGSVKALVPAEKDAIPTLDKRVTETTSGEGATSAPPLQNDRGVLPVTSSDQVISVEDASGGTPCNKEIAVGSSPCTIDPQTSFRSGDTRAAPSVVIFNTTVETFLEKLVEAGSYQRFAKCYQGFYKFQPEMTRSIYDQFITQLKTSFKDEIQEIKEEGNLEALLDSLDKIKDEAKSRVEPGWRPSGIPEEDLQSTLVPYYLQQKEYMRKVLKEKESENAKLAESVLAGRKRIAELQRQIQERKKSWQAMGKAKTELVMSLQELKSESLKGDH